MDAALAHAESLGASIVVSVVDRGGHVVAKARMDGSTLLCVGLADDKAYTAVALEMPSDGLAELVLPGGYLHGLNVVQSGRVVPFGGGVPVRDAAGGVSGAIGVSGGTTEQDVEIAQAAVRSVT
ncbi:heme-binding protein [Baekduia soli]|uniref:Heme-binding protein n=1 Tax=Baekduia soli TaxID=496014 RepID=A0A5B8U6G1_9ACTN|nr:heme-binding protein [Baekduia soli]QEC48428.1 heme-binding protein [Baekduia soli]